jgi:hypothetical protein
LAGSAQDFLACIAVAVQHGASPPGGVFLRLEERARRIGAVVTLRAVDVAMPIDGAAMSAPSPVEPRGVAFSAPASTRRSSGRRWTDPKTRRTRDRPSLGNKKPLIMSGVVRIAPGFIAGVFDLNDEIAPRIARRVNAPECRPQSIGPVR